MTIKTLFLSYIEGSGKADNDVLPTLEALANKEGVEIISIDHNYQHMPVRALSVLVVYKEETQKKTPPKRGQSSAKKA